MDSLRSNKPIIIVLSLLLLVLIGAGMGFIQQATRPPEAHQGPQILEILPASSHPVSRATSLEFLFNQRMDRDSVKQALRITPPFPYDLEWRSEGRGERLIVQPRDSLKWDTTYHAVLGASARNTEGRPLANAVNVNFATGSKVDIDQFYPSANQDGVPLRTSIVVRFKEPIVEVASLSEQEQLSQPILLNPPVQGVGSWIAPDTYTFTPEEGLLPGTEYQVTVSPVVAAGKELDQSQEWRFVTEEPWVEASFPYDGADQVERATAIKLSFSYPMDPDSVKNHFSLHEKARQAEVAGTLSWINEREAVFTLSDTLKADTTYELIVDEGARARSGTGRLASPYRAAFTTIDFLAVDSVQPAPGSTEVSIVPTDTVIAIQFNHPVVSLVGEAGRDELPNPLQITPPIEGEGEWLTTSLFVYRPTERLAPSMEYVMTVQERLEDAIGSYLPESYSWSFTTEFPRVIRVEPSNARRHVSPTGPIGLRFNQAMDRPSSEQAFSLLDSQDNPVPGRFSWKDRNTLLQFFPERPLVPDQRYTIRLGTGAQGQSGGETLQPFEAEVIAAPPLQVVSTSPAAGEQAANPHHGLAITFNTPIDPSQVLQYITLVPTVTNVYTYYEAEQLTLHLGWSRTLQPSTRYTVTLSGDLQDESGQTLGEPQTFTFQSAALPPELRPVEPLGLIGTYNPFTRTVQIIQHRNLSRLDFNLYSVSDEELTELLSAPDYSHLERIPRTPETLRHSWSTELESSPNSWSVHRAPLPPEGSLQPGNYLLEISGTTMAGLAGDFPIEQSHYLMLSLTPVNLTIKRAPDALLVWATDMQSGAVVPELDISLMFKHGEEVARGRTDQNGLFIYRAASAEVLGNPGAPIRAIARDEDGKIIGLASNDWSEGIQPWHWGISTYEQPNRLTGLVYTDRPIYRPGQTVYYRGIIRQRDGTALLLPELTRMEARLVSVHGNQTIDRQEIVLSPFGSFHGEFTLDEKASTGPYSIQFYQEEIGACWHTPPCTWEQLIAPFTVAEFERPEFEVKVEWDEGAIVRGNAGQATVSGTYYSGGGMGDAPFSWFLRSQPYHFEVPNLPGYWVWQDQDDFFFAPEAHGMTRLEFLQNGEGTLDPAGQATLSFPTPLEAEQSISGSRRLILEASIHDVNDRVISGRDEMVMHAGNFYIGLQSESYVGQVGQPFTLQLLTASTEGILEGGHDVTVELYRREWTSTREANQHGDLVWQSRYSDTLISSLPVTTDDEGRATATLTAETGGHYTILARGKDAQGNEVRSRLYYWVSEPGESAIWTISDHDRIRLVADKEAYEVGEVARILVPTPYEGMSALITEEGLTIHEARVQQFEGTSSVIEIPITEQMIPNRVIGVVAVAGIGEGSAVPEFRVGYVELKVRPTSKLLNVAVTPTNVPENGVVQPGQEVTLEIEVTDSQGRPVESELSLALVDKAILSLQEDQQSSLLEAFYAPQPLAVRIGSSFIVNLDRINQRFLPGVTEGGGGGGGGEPGFETIRDEFLDTAFWRADLVTDEKGRASVTVSLPDNLTTWVLTARAVTIEGPLVGEHRQELLTSLPLLVRPTLPRFFIVGDQAELRAVVHNNSEIPLEGTVSFEASGLSLQEGVTATQHLQLPAGGRRVVSFPVKAEDVESTTVRIQVESDRYSDTVEQTLPVYHPTAPEVVATSGVIHAGEGAAVESFQLPRGSNPSQGGLTLELSPSLAGTTESALDWVELYPYESVETVVSTLLPNAVTTRALARTDLARPDLEAPLRVNATASIEKLTAWQNPDGGWGWWPDDRSNSWLTAYSLLALQSAVQAGYSVPADSIERASRYLDRWLDRTAELQDETSLESRAFVLYVLSEVEKGDGRRAVELFNRHSLLDIDGLAFLLLALDNAGSPQDDRVHTLAAKLTARALIGAPAGSPTASATGAHWEESRPNPLTLDSSLRSTAIAIRALVRVQPEHLLLPQAVRWLVQAQANQAGHWQTTEQSSWAILALTDYMIASEELKADFGYEVILNGELVSSGQATRDTLMTPVTLEMDIKELLLDEANRVVFTRLQPRGNQRDSGRLYYSAWLRYYLPVEQLEPQVNGLSVERRYESVDPTTLTSTGSRVERVNVGELVQVRLTVQAPNELHFFTLEDPIPAGFEVVDPTLLSNLQGVQGPMGRRVEPERSHSPFWYDGWSEHIIRDEKVVLFSDRLSRGTYEYTYLLRATIPGEFSALPALGYEHYRPEVYGRSAGERLTVLTADPSTSVASTRRRNR